VALAPNWALVSKGGERIRISAGLTASRAPPEGRERGPSGGKRRQSRKRKNEAEGLGQPFKRGNQTASQPRKSRPGGALAHAEKKAAREGRSRPAATEGVHAKKKKKPFRNTSSSRREIQGGHREGINGEKYLINTVLRKRKRDRTL